jgi:hypothetical protein
VGKPVTLLAGPGTVVFRLTVRAQDAVFVRGTLEASDGLGNVFAQSGGDLLVVGTDSLAGSLQATLLDLVDELHGSLAGPFRGDDAGAPWLGGG